MTKFWLNNRGVVRVSGVDAASFLQGLISNDINKAEEKRLLYALFLSPQGKFLYDLFILRELDSSFIIDLPLLYVGEFLKKLAMYKLRSEVALEDVSDSYKVFFSESKNDISSPDPRNTELGYRTISKDISDFKEGLDIYEQNRIRLLIPDAEKDLIYNKSFPLEYGLEKLNAIDFKKGCYIGQELTARTYHRGEVRKQLYKFSSDHSLAKEAVINSNGEKIGIILGMFGKHGLCLLRKEELAQASDKAQKFEVEGREILIEK
jgi:folate-binding protein YgfZ